MTSQLHAATPADGLTLPVLTYATGEGWQSLGSATSVEGARRIVRRHLPTSSRVLVDQHGFKLTVFRRTDLQRELNGGPDGFVWSVGK